MFCVYRRRANLEAIQCFEAWNSFETWNGVAKIGPSTP